MIRAMPQFLRFLSAHPAPANVALALVRGPLSRYGAVSSIMWLGSDHDALHLIASYANGPLAEARYGVIATTVDMPATQVFRDGVTMTVPVNRMATDYAALSLDADLWDELSAASADAVILNAPILAHGKPIGVWGFTADRSIPTDADDLAYFLGLSSILGIWLTHPRTPVPKPPAGPIGADEPIVLTDRQQRILERVLAGQSNAQIANALGYSLSTVKQDMQRALRSMRAAERSLAADRARDLGLLANTHHGTA